MEFSCEEILQKMQRDINCLSDTNKLTRRRSLEKIHNELLANSNRHVLFELLNSGIMKVLLKSFSDSMERCRSIAISTVSKCITAIPSPVPFLPLVVPVIVSRFTSQEECEPSEEIRLDLVESLSLFIDTSGIDIAPYTHDFITILRISVIDPYPEVKKESCKCCSKLSKTVPHVFHQEGELLSKPLLQSMTHQHSKVRTACVEAFGNIVQYGNATSINDGLPVLAQRICDPTATVRLTTVRVIGNWLLDLGDRYSYHHKLIPLLLTGFSDEVVEIGLLSQELWNKIGLKYGEENEEELKDQLDFSRPRDPFPELGRTRPILGCRVLVYRSFSKILPALLKDIVDWTVNSRIKSSQLLVTLLFHLEEQMTHHLQGIIRAFYRASQDEEAIVASEAIKATQLIGFYVPIDVWCYVILPAISVSAGCSTKSSFKGQTDYDESSIAVGPYHCTGCLIVLSNLLKGYSLIAELQVDINYLKDIGSCLNQPEVGQTSNTILLQQLLYCVEAVVSVANRLSTPFPASLSLDLFSIILKINADHRSSFSKEIDNVLIMLSTVQGLSNTSLLYSTHIRSIINSVKDSYKSWTHMSQECGIFASVVSGQMAGNALASVLADVIPIFSYCTGHNRNPEMQLRFITILIEIILNSNKCDDLANQLNFYSIDIITTVFIPACIWRGGRTAAAIRTAALTGIQSLLVSQCVSSIQVANILKDLLSQVLSCLDDDNFSTRKVACRITKLLLKDTPECFKVEQLHEIFCDLSKRLDDNSDEIRMETIETLLFYFKAFPIDYNTVLYNAHVELMYKGLLVHMDDPSIIIQTGVMSVLIEASRLNSSLLSSMIGSVRSRHRTTEYCDKIISILQQTN